MKEWLLSKKDRFSIKLRKPDFGPKVFCIGFNKTGTTSMGKAFEMLGLRNSSFSLYAWEQYKKKRFGRLIIYASKFDSFDDLPWLYEDMIPIVDHVFKGSKFVYLTRDEKSWKNSFYNWKHNITGKYPDINRAYNNYLKHYRFVTNYFKGRQDCLTIQITDPIGYAKLSKFLDMPFVQNQFPHFNKT